MIDTVDRTSAIGLFNTARSYWRSGAYLIAGKLEVTHPSAPINFLLCHAMELYLKAFLRSAALTIDDLKRLGHGFNALVGAARKNGLIIDAETAEVLSHIATEDVAMEARYIVTGFKEALTVEALSSTAGNLDAVVAAALEKKGHAVRELNTGLPAPPRKDGLTAEEGEILVYMFNHDDQYLRDISAMAGNLRMKEGKLKYYLDRLDAQGLATCTGGNLLHGHVYWALTSQGRAYVVERDLV
jgi:hypothetical protein